MSTTIEHYNHAHNILISIRNDIEAEGERGELTVDEWYLYTHIINAMLNVMGIRRAGLRFPDDEAG